MVITWQYIAGFFDGEGSVRVPLGSGSGGASPHITITQAGQMGKQTLKEIGDFLARVGIKSGFDERGKRFEHHQPVFRLYLYGQAALKFLRCIFPWLRIKKVPAQDLLRFYSLFPLFKGGYPPKKRVNVSPEVLA